jgi:WD40 repeat protein
VAFSPDGQTVLTGSYDKTARLWDARTGAPRGEPLKHEGWVVAVALSPDGQTVLTGSHDQTARLWDARTGAPRSEPLKHDHPVVAVEFSPDGQTVFTASSDKTARSWDMAVPVIVDSQYPIRLRLSIETRTGKRLTNTGVVQQLTFDEWNTRRLCLEQMGGPCDRPTWEKYNEWKQKPKTKKTVVDVECPPATKGGAQEAKQAK